MNTLEITDFKTVSPYRNDGRPNHPIADNEQLAAIGRRVMVRRDCRAGQFSLFVAPEGILTCGWVLAVEQK